MARLQELVGDDLVVTENVLRMLNAISSMRRVEGFGPRQIEAGGVERRQAGGNNAAAAAVSDICGWRMCVCVLHIK